VGLKIGSKTPPEIAVPSFAEMNGGQAGRADPGNDRTVEGQRLGRLRGSAKLSYSPSPSWGSSWRNDPRHSSSSRLFEALSARTSSYRRCCGRARSRNADRACRRKAPARCATRNRSRFVRPRAQKLARICAMPDATLSFAKNAAEGMGTSLAAGVRAASEADGWVIALADMPFLRPETVRIVAQPSRRARRSRLRCNRGERGHPVGFAAVSRRAVFAARRRWRAPIHSRTPRMGEVVRGRRPRAVHDIDKPSDLER